MKTDVKCSVVISGTTSVYTGWLRKK